MLWTSLEAVIEVRCHLLEALRSIAADAADSAVLQINEAEERHWSLTSVGTIHLELVEYSVKI
jgi:hypothetical protein